MTTSKANRLAAIVGDFAEVKILRATQDGQTNTSIRLPRLPVRHKKQVVLELAKQGYGVILGKKTLTVDWEDVCLAH